MDTTTPQTAQPSGLAQIVVHRGHIFRELINLFKGNSDVDFAIDIISAHVILPNGDAEQAQDNGGVMRDMLSEFWEDFYEQCTTGSSIKVPCLRHDFDTNDWKAVAHVIAMGWILQKVLPIRLAQSFPSASFYGITQDLREEFFDFITTRNVKLSLMLSKTLTIQIWMTY